MLIDVDKKAVNGVRIDILCRGHTKACATLDNCPNLNGDDVELVSVVCYVTLVQNRIVSLHFCIFFNSLLEITF